LRPPATKITDFEVKNSCKSGKEAKAAHLLNLFCLSVFKETHFASETNSTKLQW